MAKTLPEYEITLYSDKATGHVEQVTAFDAYLEGGNLILTDPEGNWVAVYVTGSWTRLRRL